MVTYMLSIGLVHLHSTSSRVLCQAANADRSALTNRCCRCLRYPDRCLNSRRRPLRRKGVARRPPQTPTGQGTSAPLGCCRPAPLDAAACAGTPTAAGTTRRRTKAQRWRLPACARRGRRAGRRARSAAPARRCHSHLSHPQQGPASGCCSRARSRRACWAASQTLADRTLMLGNLSCRP